MKLVLKVPKGKLPFIGIEVGEHTSDRDNADLIKYHSDKDYKVVLEYNGKRLQLRLICEELVTVRFYESLEFEPQKLKDWLFITRKNRSFNFGHVFLKGNTHYISRLTEGRRMFLLKVSDVEFITNENGQRENPFSSTTGYGDFQFN